MRDPLLPSPALPVFTVSSEADAPRGDVLPALARLLLQIAQHRIEERSEREKEVRA
jgi:hypothetical protein